MAEYERMVSYFYRYQNGEKLDNVGFGKFELRQGRLKVTINMNDNRMMGTSVYRVYLYQYVAGQMRLTELGQVEEQKGGLHFHFERDAVEILKQESLSLFSGVLVYQSEQIFYGSQWNDDPIRVRGLLMDMDSQMQKQSEQTQLESQGEEEETSAANVDVHSDRNKISQSGQADEREEDEKSVNDFISKTMDTIQEQSLETERVSEPLTGIPYLLKHRPTLPAFANHEVMHCVRIQPEDIGLLHRDNWEYGNNSFVMHGYYQYRYLLLGCMQYQDGTKQYVIGVPGIFSNKDKYLANIFKFHEFIPIKNCPFRTGEFGYWIGKLKNS